MSDTELVSRVGNLERDNRRLKAFAIGALVLAAALGGIYSTRPLPRKITAREFDVVDGSGRARAIMRVQPDGMALIEVDDARGVPRASIATPSSGVPSIEIFGPQGEAPVASMGASEVGAGAITLNDAKGQRRAGIAGANSSGTSGIWLFDPDGNPRAVMTVGASSAPGIRLSDAQGFNMYMGSTSMESPSTGVKQQTSAASIVMSGKDHRIVWQAP